MLLQLEPAWALEEPQVQVQVQVQVQALVQGLGWWLGLALEPG